MPGTILSAGEPGAVSGVPGVPSGDPGDAVGTVLADDDNAVGLVLSVAAEDGATAGGAMDSAGDAAVEDMVVEGVAVEDAPSEDVSVGDVAVGDVAGTTGGSIPVGTAETEEGVFTGVLSNGSSELRAELDAAFEGAAEGVGADAAAEVVDAAGGGAVPAEAAATGFAGAVCGPCVFAGSTGLGEGSGGFSASCFNRDAILSASAGLSHFR